MTAPVTLGPVRPEHHANIGNWWARTDLHTRIGVLTRPNDVASWYRRDTVVASAIYVDGRFSGVVELYDVASLHQLGQLGILIGEIAHRGRGVGRSALVAFLGECFKSRAIRRVEAHVLATDSRSGRLLRAVGFHEEGRLRQRVQVEGALTDQIQLGLLRHDFRDLGGPAPPDLNDRLKTVRAVVCDCDGTLTDGGLLYSGDSVSIRFHVADGLAVKLLAKRGIPVALVTGRNFGELQARARHLGIEHVLIGVDDKKRAVEELAARLGITLADVLYVGDDLTDLAVMEHVGASMTVSNAAPEALAAADRVTVAAGGAGVLREVAELVLRARGEWRDLVAEFRGPPRPA